MDVLTALTLCVTASSILTPIPSPKGWKSVSVVGLSAAGDMVIDAQQGEKFANFYYGKGGFAPLTIGKTKFDLPEKDFDQITISQFMPDGRYTGGRRYRRFDGDQGWVDRPYLGDKQILKPAAIPRALQKWSTLEAKAVLLDGSVLMEGIEKHVRNTHPHVEMPPSELLIVKDGKLKTRLGAGSNPLIDKSGRIIATQYLFNGKPVGFTNNFWTPFVVVFENGSPRRITEGIAVAALDNGDIIFRRARPGYLDATAHDPRHYTIHRLRNGRVNDFPLPGRVQTTMTIQMDSKGRGIVQGEGGTHVFNRFRSYELTLPAGCSFIHIEAFNEGHFAIAAYDKNQKISLYSGQID